MQLVTQLVTRVPLHGPKTLVKKNGLVRPLVTTPSNGPVRKLVTRCLSQLIKTSVGNKLQAKIATFPRPCLFFYRTSVKGRASDFSGPKIVKISDSDSVTIGFLVSLVLSIHMDRTSPGKMLASLATLHQGAPSRCIILDSFMHPFYCSGAQSASAAASRASKQALAVAESMS